VARRSPAGAVFPASLDPGRRNGPYLVTNVPTVRSHLGITKGAPQLALCRCGASAVKPACDGTCHANGSATRQDPAGSPTAATPTPASR